MLTRYLLREILSNLLWVLSLGLLLLYLARMADFGPEIFARGGQVADLLRFSGYLLLFLLPFALPLAGLAGVLLAFIRLAHDREILALASLGISPLRLTRAVALTAAGLFALALLLTLLLVPQAKRRMRDTLWQLAVKRLERGLPEKTPVDWFPGTLLYARRVKEGFRLKDVYILREGPGGKKGFLYARRGRLTLFPGGAELLLEKGEGHFFSSDLQRVENLYFESYRYRFPLSPPEERELKRGEMGLFELLSRARSSKLPPHKRRKYLAEFYQRFFYPLAALVLPFLGLPLGLSLKASGRAPALILGLLLHLFYYLLFSLGSTLAEEGKLAPPLALGLAPALFLALGLVLWRFSLRREGL
ncbi:LptF/LptG family permease [Thermosulfurimonas marina]|uniref:LptF/LptG family permease n=1 Tax=Thermosulfurimonas marina TaxID=2047767 RepID=A0A6H1WTQ7_9BACT|nr:LptF/LptG family permease [Thermosulfurimonas marina]QJA06568.1 LptF/LptG family permease [Thermosulfurimonas marina]